MAVLEKLAEMLSQGLNRTVAPGLVQVMVRLYRENRTKDKFAEATKALGFSDSLSSAVYVFINDNIARVESESSARSQNAVETVKKPPFREHRPAKKAASSGSTSGKRKMALDLGGSEEEDMDVDLQTRRDVSGPKAGPVQAPDLLETELGLDETPAPRKITFKKIKKTDARRIKGTFGSTDGIIDRKTEEEDVKEGGGADNRDTKRLKESSDATNSKLDTNQHLESGVKVPRLHSPDASVSGQSRDHDSDTSGVWHDLAHTLPLETDTTENIENDREWYTLEDSATAAVDQYLDLEQDYARPAHKQRTKQPVQRQSQNRSGGGFSASGEYRDYDHDSGSARSRIPILAHFIVPPFLRGSEHHLTLQLDSTRAGRSTGPSVNPVKDPESELAVAARTGSFIIRDRKEKLERAKQATARIEGGDNSTEPAENQPGNSQERSRGNDQRGLAVNEPTDNRPAYKQPPKEASANTDSESSTYSFEEIQAQRRSLPAFSVRDELLAMVAQNQIVVVIGETGSGKTTQISQFLAEAGYTKSLARDGSRQLVACTQPRRVAAMSVAKRVAEEMGVPLGEDVGYTIRFEDRTSHRRTRIKYMTEGILLRELLEDPALMQYSCIIMDEAHERSLNTDVLLGLFRQLLRRRRDLRLIVTSATMNADRFSQYFGNAPQFFIPGRTFPVEVFYSQSRCADYVETAVKQVVTIHLANPKGDGDILVFMTGQEDIEATCELIHEKLALLENPPPLDVLPIYSTLPADVQKRIFARQSHERRKVVVATNIAETSLTVDGIRYVVDCGLVKMKLFNPKLGMDALQMVPISMANAQQRSGRAGRTAPGLAYRLFTEAASSPAQMYLQPIPEIQRTNLSAVMLLLKSLHVEDILRFPFLDAPPSDLLACSLYELWAMGALEHSGTLTALGEKMSTFPMEPTLAKLLILATGPDFHCAAEIVTIVAMLSVPSVFYRPKERADEADAMRERFLVADSDHLTLLNVYTQWEQRAKSHNMTMAKLAAWSGRHFLQHRSLLRAKEVRTQLEAIMAKLKYPMSRARSDADIRKCICAAYFHQSASLEKMSGGGRGQAEYANLRQSYMKVYLHPTSALVGGADLSPQYVVYDELVLTKKEYMQCVTAVEPEWLLEYGAVFYGVSPRVKKELQMERGIKILDREEIEAQMVEVQPKVEVGHEAVKPAKRMKVKRNF